MASQTTKLEITKREPGSSRATRRLRREGLVPGVLYGGGSDPVTFQVDERALRHALHAVGAVVELTIDGQSTPAVLKATQHHPVRGQTLHVDFLRVRLDRAIQAQVAVHLVGAEDAPGVKEGGVLEHVTRDVTIEALPTDIPEAVEVDVSAMEINTTLTLAAISPPAGVTLVVDDPEETVVATITPPTVEPVEEEIEEETGVVGEGVEAEGAEEAAGEQPAAEGEGSGE